MLVFQTGDESRTSFLRCHDSVGCTWHFGGDLLASGPAMAYRSNPCYESIRFANIRRNEVKSKISAQNVRTVMMGGSKPLYIHTAEDIQQRAAMVLKNVHYVIEAHFTMTERARDGDNPGKFQDIIKRRLNSGQCYHQPYFGCREFPVSFRPYEEGSCISWYQNEERRDLGYMLYDIDYSDLQNINPCSFA